MSEVLPVGANVQSTWLNVSVTAANGGAGDAVSNSTDSLDVLVRNVGDWPVEVKVDSGEWIVLDQLKYKVFDVSLATSTIRLRKGVIADAGLVRLEIASLVGTYAVDGENLSLGGASSFLDLTDAPGPYAGYGNRVPSVLSDESGLQWSELLYLDTDNNGFELLGGAGNGLIQVTGGGYLRLNVDGVGYIGLVTDGGTMELNAAGEAQITSTKLFLYTLPTSNPVVAGQVWNDAGTLKISAG
jgi:hypothetical protein